ERGDAFCPERTDIGAIEEADDKYGERKDSKRLEGELPGRSLPIAGACQSRKHGEDDAVACRKGRGQTGDDGENKAESGALLIVRACQLLRVADHLASNEILSEAVHPVIVPEAGNQNSQPYRTNGP